MPTMATEIASTGVARTWMMLVPYIAQTKRGRRNQWRPRARIVCVVTMKLTPVMMVDHPRMKTPTTVGTTALGACTLYGA